MPNACSRVAWGRTICLFLSFALNMMANALAGSVTEGKPPIWPMAQSVKDTSDKYPTTLTPQGWAFSIWGCIYLSFIAYIIWQALPAQADHPLLERLALLQIVGQIGSTVFIVVFSNEFLWTSTVLILVALALLLQAYYTMGVGVAYVPLKEKLCCHLTISLNLAWVIYATLCCLGAFLRKKGFEMDDDWGVGCVLLIGAVSVYISLSRADVAFIGVTIWSYLALAPNQSDLISKVAYSCAAALSIFLLVGLFLRYLDDREQERGPKKQVLADRNSRYVTKFWVDRDELAKEYYAYANKKTSHLSQSLLLGERH
eukprot:gb/GEZN01008941.1/.p1 GENE.gb/GEZN01008941.1/~~gb/GEZN01008941.1/.p1  ORF type:complete len:314 (-),score=37.26 gb/GEZN01008941.1/:147-1088(-)